MALATTVRGLARGLRLRVQVQPLQVLESTRAEAHNPFRVAARTFASGGKGVTYEGVTVPEPSKWHKLGAQFFGGLMWFWIFYRLRHDYDVFLFGHAQHFEHELAHEKEHGKAGHH